MTTSVRWYSNQQTKDFADTNVDYLEEIMYEEELIKVKDVRHMVERYMADAKHIHIDTNSFNRLVIEKAYDAVNVSDIVNYLIRRKLIGGN